MRRLCWTAVRSLICAMLLTTACDRWASAQDAARQPTRQDMQILGRVLGIQAGTPSGSLVIAVLFNPASVASRSEAEAITALLEGGLAVGALTMKPVLVDQTRLADVSGFDAVFETTGLDDRAMPSLLAHRKVLCVTRHLEQVARGSCMVSVASDPSISVSISVANAAAASIEFATALRLMVREV